MGATLVLGATLVMDATLVLDARKTGRQAGWTRGDALAAAGCRAGRTGGPGRGAGPAGPGGRARTGFF